MFQCSSVRGVHRYMLNTVRHLSRSMIFSKEDLVENKPIIVHLAGDENVLYSSYMDHRRIGVDPQSRKKVIKKHQRLELDERKENAVPLIVEKLLPKKESEEFERELDLETDNVLLPYNVVEDIDIKTLESKLKTIEEHEWDSNSGVSLQEDIAKRIQIYEKCLSDLEYIKNYKKSNDPANSEHSRPSVEDELDIDGDIKYGTCDQSIPISRVTCGGCGALFHCQDYALPGFIPKELLERLNPGELRSVICQRCYYLKHHEMALNVKVSPAVYQKILEPIKEKRALVIVIVDILDVPCSIWPNLIDIIGTRRPVVVVGNKVDLLPADDINHLERIKESLKAVIDQSSLGRCNIRHIALISALTGFGIESLITKIQTSWGVKGDIYLIGCTNSGKSTLFNALLGSDMCKTKASHLIRRATTSPWPGTTLNMLKFPLLRPSDKRLYEREQRLIQQNVIHTSDKKREYTSDVDLATLSGNIGRTFDNKEPDETSDVFSSKVNAPSRASIKIIGIKESDPDYVASKWLYDTPGTVQPDQMINLLTHEELMIVLPRKLIRPQTFILSSGKTLFIGGLARLDVLYSPSFVRFTVFTAAKVPVNVVKTVGASVFYSKYLGTPVLGPPIGSEERFQHWPLLTPCNIRMISDNSKECCGDVVLSSAGWVAVNAPKDNVIEMRGWTPGGRGIYLRTPAMLPKIVSLRGRRLEKSPVYRKHKLLIPTYKKDSY